MKTRMNRHAPLAARSLLCAALVLAAACLPQAGRAQDFPSRAVTLIVPSSPGGSADLFARLVAEPLSRALGQPVVVENRAGAGGAIGMQAVASAPADGYAIGVGTASTLTTNPLMNKAAKVDPTRDLTPITPLVSIPGILTVHNSFEADDLPAFIAQAKARPDYYTMGSSGYGSIGHLVVEAINQELGIELRHIPYRGMGLAIVAALSGESQVLFDQYSSSRPHVMDGKFKPLAVAWDSRLPDLPAVPTFQELGYPELNALTVTWFGLVGPAGLPAPVLERLNAAAREALADPATVARIQEVGARPIAGSPADLAGMISSSLARNRKIIELRGLTFD